MVDYRYDPFAYGDQFEWDYPPAEEPSYTSPYDPTLLRRSMDPTVDLAPLSPEAEAALAEPTRRGLFTGPSNFGRFAVESAKELPGAVYDAVTYPGALLLGEDPIYGDVPPDPRSDAGIRRAVDLAGTVTLGGGALPKGAAPRGALRSGYARPLDPDMEHITSAAIFGPDGKIYTGQMHYQIGETLPPDVAKVFWDDYRPEREGFITSKGRFVDRDEADYIARASGQIDDTLTGQRTLSSEDLLAHAWGGDEDDMLSANRSVAAGAVPIFSRLEREAARLQPKATGEQHAATLRNKGVPQEELDWTGVADWLRERGTLPVTKDELLSQIAQRQTQVGTTRLGTEPTIRDEDLGEARQWLQKYDVNFDDGYAGTDWSTADVDQIHNAALSRGWVPSHDRTVEGPPRYANYQLPGGENYREVLLTLPKQGPRISVRQGPDGLEAFDTSTGKRVHSQRPGEDIYAWAEAENKKGQPQDPTEFRSSHWDEPNVLAHMRVNDRFIERSEPRQLTKGERAARGSTSDIDNYYDRVLFAEEIQSDWHQKGRREGYKDDQPRPYEIVGQGNNWQVQWKDEQGGYSGGFGSRAEAEQAATQRATTTKQGVPNAPFKKTWPDLVLKRLVADAIEGGYDAVAWTDGATQAARYDLSKQISSINYLRNGRDIGQLRAFDHDGNQVINQRLQPEELADYIGKDAADRLLQNGDQSGFYELVGEDLQVGGEGMKAFYDTELPRRAKKLFGKYGAQVEDSVMPGDKDLDPRTIQGDLNAGTHQVHILRITPEMRAAIQKEGLPLYANRSKAAGAVATENDEEPRYRTGGRFAAGGGVRVEVNGKTYMDRARAQGRPMSRNVEDRRGSQKDDVNRANKGDRLPGAVETLREMPELLYPMEIYGDEDEFRTDSTITEGIPQSIEELILRQGGDQFTSGLVEDATPGRTDRLPTSMPADSYVIPADIVSGIGQGNTLAGAAILDAMFKGHSSEPPAKAAGGSVSKGTMTSTQRVPVIVAGGEYVVPPAAVRSIGGGDVTKGHKLLDSFTKRNRVKLVRRLKSLPGPRRD